MDSASRPPASEPASQPASAAGHEVAFAPVADARCEILILGSMPGRPSLAAGQYYAHPRNAFWKILATVTGTGAEAPYAARTQALLHQRIALWDVLHSCRRPDSSLDARIEADSVCANDFAAFFAQHPRIRRVCFNGATAEALFRRHVLPALNGRAPDAVRLPSTSPAHAARSFAQKCTSWRAALLSAGAATP